VIALLLALTLVAPEQGEDPTPPPLTVSEWRALGEETRRLMLVGGVEGLMLAASGPRGDETGIDQDCLGRWTIDGLDKALMNEATPAGTPLTSAVMEAAQCPR